MSMKPKILFTSPCGPYAKLSVAEDPIDYFYYRNTFGQKMFKLRSFQSWHSLHFLAQNIPIPSLVLENPTEKIFQAEVNSGQYGIISIGFTILLTKKVYEMVSWVKEKHPNIIVVVGGYGTAVFKESFETSDKLKALCDYICYGEGVGFLNKIIKEKWGIKSNKEIVQDFLPAKNSFFRTHIQLFKQIILVGGLGCVYGCSFCSTSSQFNRRYIPLFSGKQLFNSLLQQAQKHPNIPSAIIYDEDFLLNRKQVLEFMEHFNNSELQKRPFLLTVFASVKSIMQYSIEEILKCGIGTIFIGVESLEENVLAKEGLPKRYGNVEELFKELHAHGINTLGSLIIGWDSQDEAVAKRDSQRFVTMNPTFYQVVPLHVVPGTKLWDTMKAEGRIDVDYKVEYDGITDFNFASKSFSHDKAKALVFETYTELVKEGGPWPFRLFENLINGYTLLKGSNNALFVQRARTYKSLLWPLILMAFASRFFFIGKAFRKRWNHTMKIYFKEMPFIAIFIALASPVVAFILLFIYLIANLLYALIPLGDQPDFIRREY